MDIFTLVERDIHSTLDVERLNVECFTALKGSVWGGGALMSMFMTMDTHILYNSWVYTEGYNK
jgi:hypothetical protein